MRIVLNPVGLDPNGVRAIDGFMSNLHYEWRSPVHPVSAGAEALRPKSAHVMCCSKSNTFIARPQETQP